MDKIKMFLMKLTEEELKVVEYTSEKVAWGPTTEQMDEITNLSRSYEKRNKILDKMFEHFRDSSNKYHWKQVYKNLLLVEHMCIHADEDCIRYFRDNVRLIASLKDNYRYRDDDGSDKGINVRKRAEAVADLIVDEQLQQKRQEGQAQKSKFSACITNTEGNFKTNEPFSGLPKTSKYDSMSIGSSSYNQQPAQPPVQQYQPPVQQYQPPVQQYQQPPVQQYQQPVQQPVQQYQQPAQLQFAPVQPVQQFKPAPMQQAKPVQQPDLLEDLFGTAPAPAQQQFAQPVAQFQQPAAPQFQQQVQQQQFYQAPVQQQRQQPVVQFPGQPQVQAPKQAPKPDLNSLLDF
ncbi:Epsin_related protein [Hexamita inflata]|uniref:Epsin related protein n=1 Tax=Hexamita inflata TaxID=28002 RepID=A0AA86RYY2_9EUKA|nr:Epsin related protein [Hexamita inflata]